MDKRTCFYIDPTQTPDEDGYIPSLVTEGEPGHAPLTGGGTSRRPGTGVRPSQRPRPPQPRPTPSRACPPATSSTSS